MSNPGPATTVTANYVGVPQNAIRLIGFVKGLSVAAAGDTKLNMLTATSSFLPLYVVTANSSGTADISSATVGVYTGAAQTGTTVFTTAACTGQTTQPFVYVRTPTNAATAIANAGQLYANVGTTVAGGVCDLYVYGIDLS